MIIHGDSLDELKSLESESVDLLCTDPPYGYSFMGKSWDKALPDIGIFKECFRVLKPGAFAFVMSAPRSDVCSRMALLLEDAGFNIAFTPIYWTYASGFPKAMNIGKMVDKRSGEVEFPKNEPVSDNGSMTGANYTRKPAPPRTTDAAKALDGSYGGFQPKPAVEVVIVAMKPLSEKTYVDQALANGKGITWLDDCRVPIASEGEDPRLGGNGSWTTTKEQTVYGGGAGIPRGTVASSADGRFPANLVVSDDTLNGHSRFFSLDAWAQTLPFLAVPKAAKSEKNAGLQDREEVTVGDGPPVPIDNAFQRGKTERKNSHPTVKPLKLMSYLITLGSRPGNVVLDPFLGSGTTALAAKQLGRNYIGIEREQEYVEIARARLAAVSDTLL